MAIEGNLLFKLKFQTRLYINWLEYWLTWTYYINIKDGVQGPARVGIVLFEKQHTIGNTTNVTHKYGDITNKSGDLMGYDRIFDVTLTSKWAVFNFPISYTIQYLGNGHVPWLEFLLQ